MGPGRRLGILTGAQAQAGHERIVGARPTCRCRQERLEDEHQNGERHKPVALAAQTTKKRPWPFGHPVVYPVLVDRYLIPMILMFQIAEVRRFVGRPARDTPDHAGQGVDAALDQRQRQQPGRVHRPGQPHRRRLRG